VGEIRVFQEIENQVGIDVGRKIGVRLVQDRRQDLCHGKGLKKKPASSAKTDASNLAFPALTLLEDENPLGLRVRKRTVPHRMINAALAVANSGIGSIRPRP
jgi:hypothetical protein